jgi:hypothetical protein
MPMAKHPVFDEKNPSTAEGLLLIEYAFDFGQDWDSDRDEYRKIEF